MFRSLVLLTLVVNFCPVLKSRCEGQDAAAFLKAAEPVEQHKQLESLVGNWEFNIKLPDGPEGKPASVKGTLAYKAILGGRFVQEEAKTELFGQPFEWVGMYGYDKYKSKFVAIWADNHNTIIEQGLGDADASGKVISFVGETVRPGGKSEKFHWVVALPVDGKLTIKMFAVKVDGSRGGLMMEIAAAKAK